MINQKGGFYVKIHKNMFDNLAHLSGKISNTACAVIGLNTLGVDKDIIEKAIELVGEDGSYGLYRKNTLKFYEEYLKRIREGKTDDRNIKYITDGYFDVYESLDDDIIETSFIVKSNVGFHLEPPDQKRLYDWLKERIPIGTATLLFLPGHISIVGKTGYSGDIFIIDPQLSGEGGKETLKSIRRQFTGSTMSVTRPVTGIHRGLEAVGKYLSYNFMNGMLDKDRRIAIPHRRILLDYREPQMPTEQIFKAPLLGRIPSVKLSVEEILGSLGLKKPLITIAKKAGKKGAREILNHIKNIEDTLGITAWEGIFIPEMFNISENYRELTYDLVGNVIDRQGLENPRDIEISIDKQIKEVFGERGPEIVKDAIIAGKIKNIEELGNFAKEFELDTQKGGSISYIKYLMKPRTNVIPGKFSLKNN